MGFTYEIKKKKIPTSNRDDGLPPNARPYISTGVTTTVSSLIKSEWNCGRKVQCGLFALMATIPPPMKPGLGPSKIEKSTALSTPINLDLDNVSTDG
jgi:hypothetical protein